MEQEINEKLSPYRHLYALSNWLFFCCFMVFTMIIVGAITRLSESGLSIVEWKPLIGAIPPLNEAEWHDVFNLYKTSPQYTLQNSWMELSDFKKIFFWEWFHRLLGRLIGVVYALPFLFFFIRGWIPQGYKLKLFGIFMLGGAQGFMGWYMVKSGLIDQPAVSHYRLAAHLGLAIVIYASMLLYALSFRKTVKNIMPKPDIKLYNIALLVFSLLALTILWGAYTAGLDAGLVYNDTFPHMGRTMIPEEIWFYDPIWKNFFENHAGVQFMHRWLAIITCLSVIALCLLLVHKKRQELSILLLGVFVFIQVGLGILTLFSQVYLPLAVMHQAGAVTLLTLLLIVLHALKFNGLKPPSAKQVD